jgi:MoaA/NifB/PqqE/SkfB family radical SAM enzyme
VGINKKRGVFVGRGPTQKFYKAFDEEYIEGTLTCLTPKIIKEKINIEFPLILNIEPTNICNAHCYYCPRKTMIAAKGASYLGLDDFKKIVDQVSKSSKKLIMLNLHKDGEPLLHKDLPSMVEYAKGKEIATTIHLNTNGTLINTKVGRGIIEKNIDDITISVDASLEKTYFKLKGIKGLNKLEENIKRILDFRDTIGGQTTIRVKIMEFKDLENGEIDMFIDKWANIADEVQVTGVHNWSGAIERLEITDEQSTNRYPCVLLWYMLAINSNGEASVCSVDWDYSGVVGDIHRQSIKEIWNGKCIRDIRKKHLEGIWNCPDVCKECVVWVSVGSMWEYLKTRKEFV